MYSSYKYNKEEDAALAVKFYKKSVHNKAESEKKGKQIFTNVDYISIRIPGDRSTVIDRKVTQDDRTRFEQHWENYQSKEEAKKIGTPIELIPGITPAEVAMLESFHIVTAEQLSKLAESGIKRIDNGRVLASKAKKFLDGEGYVKQLEKRIKELEAKIGGNCELTDNSPKRTRRSRTSGKADNSNRE